MSAEDTRIRIENEIFARMEKKYTEEEQANYLMSLLMDHYALLSAVMIAVGSEREDLSVFAYRGLSGNFVKEMYTGKSLPVIAEAQKGAMSVGGDRPADPALRLEHEYRTLYGAPCVFQGETIGVFLLYSDDADLLTPGNVESFSAYARLATFFLALRALRGRISRVPDVDSVTGLFTFKYFHEVLHRELTRGKKFHHPVSLLYLKIRNLRAMNEVYGHLAADSALAEIAGRIKGILREVDYAARSGAVIHVVLPQMAKGDAAAVAERIVGEMNASPVGKGDILLTVAIGVAQYPKDGETERVLIPHTEAMVHESLRKGGNAYTVYRD